ncbi:DNA damage-binding protein cmr1-like [Phragmites australis]|uniref:DNA damage-binding protein cmr1-like n=1 Tax=Phragmites australis TaxID=29695 RepID=UPI002D7A119F|nr:DNA damage-binding protein cmr1-like [Phragmites australis]
MAETLDALTEYERRRQENIQRNQAILAQLRRDAANLSAAFAAGRPKKQTRATPTAPAGSPRRSGRARLQPPSSAAASLPSAHLKPRPSHFPISDAFVIEKVTDVSAPLTSAILAASWPPPECKVRADEGFDPCCKELVLKPGNVRKLAPTVIAVARVLPLADRTVVAAGTCFGHLVFWDADRPAPARPLRGAGSLRGAADGVFKYLPHTGSVAGITAHPSAPRKIYSCTREGEICLMDVEKEIFNMIYLCDYPAFSLCQAPEHATCLYFGEGNGELKAFDERAGKVLSKWKLHCDCISSIDFNTENPNMLATSSLDSTACLWDLRNMNMLKPESLKVVKHKMQVHSAYFSPSGSFLATTSRDNAVGILSVCDFDNSCFLQHTSPSRTFKASWGWNDSDLLLGTQRDVAIISVDLKDNNISTSCKARIESEHMTEAPRQFAVHQYRVGYLACVGSNRVFLWTPEQDAEQRNVPRLTN